jgi:nitroreductase
VQNVLLGLRREGLGASFTTLLVPAEPALRQLLAIPDGVAVAGHISLGHRADPWPKELTRKPVQEFAFGDRYGEAW